MGSKTKLTENLKYFKRLFNRGLGEKGYGLKHRSVCLTTRGDGRFRTLDQDGNWLPGAPAPMHVNTATKGDKSQRHVSPAMKDGFVDESTGEFYGGIKVVAAENGSMRRELFPEWCKHYVDQLPPDQDCHGDPVANANNDWVILFIDGHTSRWSYEGLQYLRENKVPTFCLPSHTTVWAQPNDAGANREQHRERGIVVVAWQRDHCFTHKTMRLPDWNRCFIGFWSNFVDNQHSLLEFGVKKNT